MLSVSTCCTKTPLQKEKHFEAALQFVAEHLNIKQLKYG